MFSYYICLVILIRISDLWIRMRILEAQKHLDPTDPDPQHWFYVYQTHGKLRANQESAKIMPRTVHRTESSLSLDSISPRSSPGGQAQPPRYVYDYY